MAGYDAILIPGGGLLDNGGVPPWVTARLDRALEVRTTELLIALSAGTTHRRRAAFESVEAARYLIRRGAPAESVLIEASSYDTIGNAWFSRVLHAEPRRLRRLLVISSAFHIARCEAVFRWVYGLAPRAVEFELAFDAVADAGIPDEALRARRERESASLQALLPLTASCRDVHSFHRWLYGEHLAYAARAMCDPPPPATGAVLDTY